MPQKIALTLEELGADDIIYGFQIDRADLDSFMDGLARLVKQHNGKDFSELLDEDDEE